MKERWEEEKDLEQGHEEGVGGALVSKGEVPNGLEDIVEALIDGETFPARLVNLMRLTKKRRKSQEEEGGRERRGRRRRTKD